VNSGLNADELSEVLNLFSNSPLRSSGFSGDGKTVHERLYLKSHEFGVLSSAKIHTALNSTT
jgi:hypothetical protein